ncbi:uncharacterized protein [Arachis hypogaea]|uniref:uncharacterized protein n=1 Tax=Arachis hypogaea TaxID=3818 RepID=UPI000DECFB64|nr:uncharacterized protein LOC112723155 [Arachis hypogaea]
MKFNADWFDEFGNWLEYSISKDAVFCLCCYLRKPDGASGDAFVKEGFSNWKKKERLQTHVGNHDSAHNHARRKCEALIKQKFLLQQGLAFRGDDESHNSNNQGNFLELLDFLAQHNTEIDHNLFAVLVDEARDISVKEQMAVCLRYVNKEGIVMERFLGLVHVSSTNALSLKVALESLLAKHSLSLARIRGQGYDGAIGASCKRKDMLRESQMQKTIVALQNGDVSSGRGLNQETTLKRAGDTRWGSHYGTILSLISIFSSVIEVLELNNRFTEVNTELLLCIACLNPSDSFFAFDKEKLLRLAEFYPHEFSSTQLLALDSQLENFILDMRLDDQFSNINGISGLSQKLVETKKHVVYPLVFLLLKLALILPVATASVERTFSTMNIIKSRLRNRMGDEWLNDCLVEVAGFSRLAVHHCPPLPTATTPHPTTEQPVATVMPPLATNAMAAESIHGSEAADAPPPPFIVQLTIWPDGGTGFTWFPGLRQTTIHLHFIFDAEHDLNIRKIFDYIMGQGLQQMLEDVLEVVGLRGDIGEDIQVHPHVEGEQSEISNQRSQNHYVS